MGDKTKIEWTDSTWNPVTGCTKVSAGCKFCYAERLFHRPYPWRDFTDVRIHPERLDQPLRWKRPRKIFVNSISDLFHEAISEEFIGHVFATMARARQHTFQVLTKRPKTMLDLISNPEARWGPFQDAALKGDAERWPLPNVWLGVSIENQETADERIPLLLQTPASLRFVSYEPALGPVRFGRYIAIPDDEGHCSKCGCEFAGEIGQSGRHECPPGFFGPALDWIIVGGESGPHARPSHPDWFRSVRDQCVAAGVPFFFKQFGEWAPIAIHPELGDSKIPFRWMSSSGEILNRWPSVRETEMEMVLFMGRKLAGRLLDGREWNEFPEAGTDPAVRACGTSERTTRPESGSCATEKN